MIEVDGLVRTFPGRPEPALGPLSFSVREGEVIAVAGRNGSGKTTLLDVLSTLLAPSAGRVRVAGLDVERDAHAVRRQVGYAMTGPRGLLGRLTGRANLEFFAALQPGVRDPRARVREIVALLELAPFVDLQVRRCSDGMLQKLVVARALLGRPKVLLLDEPMRALDAVARRRLTDVIDTLVADGEVRAVVYVTHDLAALPDTGARVLVLSRGRLVRDAPSTGAGVAALLEADES